MSLLFETMIAYLFTRVNPENHAFTVPLFPRSIDIRVYLVIYFTKQKVEETVFLQGFRSLVCGLKDEYGIYQERTG